MEVVLEKDWLTGHTIFHYNGKSCTIHRDVKVDGALILELKRAAMYDPLFAKARMDGLVDEYERATGEKFVP